MQTDGHVCLMSDDSLCTAKCRLYNAKLSCINDNTSRNDVGATIQNLQSKSTTRKLLNKVGETVIQIKALKAEQDGRVLIGVAENLDDARIIVKYLDWLYRNALLPAQFDFYNENTEIEAWDGDRCYEYSDGDPTGASDGVWFG